MSTSESFLAVSQPPVVACPAVAPRPCRAVGAGWRAGGCGAEWRAGAGGVSRDLWAGQHGAGADAGAGQPPLRADIVAGRSPSRIQWRWGPALWRGPGRTGRRSGAVVAGGGGRRAADAARSGGGPALRRAGLPGDRGGQCERRGPDRDAPAATGGGCVGRVHPVAARWPAPAIGGAHPLAGARCAGSPPGGQCAGPAAAGAQPRTSTRRPRRYQPCLGVGS